LRDAQDKATEAADQLMLMEKAAQPPGFASDLDAAGGRAGGRMQMRKDAADGKEMAKKAVDAMRRAGGQQKGAAMGEKQREHANALADKAEPAALAAAAPAAPPAEYFADDRAKRDEMRQYYRKLDATMEWVESNYYKLPLEQQNASLIAANTFWRDF